ncbi:Rpn family recombination-promoting nuclease/putative transposase [Eisenbergiella massiliensis]|uniref:Rpn family recombination-promoting nuclease/putative transposase n=1 Tax=Eisenbergiella massiliensis TaxID=1720294 RepID=UPI0039949938
MATWLVARGNKTAYESTLSIILDEPDLKLTEVEVEQVVLNKSGKRAIRLDAWARDVSDRRFNTEMQNDTEADDVRRRVRFYQGLLDTPVLKAGKTTRYKHLPSTVIIFITQEDIFGRDRAIYTFTEQCEEFSDLPLDDGTKKIFLNMTSKNGRPELISLLQYMKNTTIDNPEVKIKDKRIITLDKIVNEVKQSEEWEAVKMNILEIGIEKGREEGRKDGLQDGLKIGRAEGEAKLVSMIRRKLKKGLNATAISEALELEDAYVQKAVDLITEDSSKSDLDIAKMLLNQ